MLELLRTTIATNAKYLAVGVGAVVLFGGASTTVSLIDNSTPTPKVTKPDKVDKVDTAERKAKTQDPAETGARPTDTHGYCVSQAVAAAKAAGKTGQDIAAAAHSCPKPNQAAKTAKTRGKSSAAPGRE